MTSLLAKPTSVHASLIEALAGRDAERALEQSFIQLSRSGDLPLLMAMLKTLVRVGLAGIATRLLQSSSAALASEPHLAALAHQLAGLPSGEIDRAMLSARCREAVQRTAQHRPQLQPLLDTVESVLLKFRVFRSIKGNVHIVRDVPGKLEFVLPFIDQMAQAETMTVPVVTLATSFALIGVPSISIWRKIAATREHTGYLPPIDLVEPDEEVLTLWLGLHEDGCSFDGDRVSIFFGPNAVGQYQQFLVDHAWRTPATHVLTNHRPSWTPPAIGRPFADVIVDSREQKQKSVLRCMRDRYVKKDTSWWRRRYESAGAGGPPLRIVGLTTRFSTVIRHAMNDLADAFRRRGCEFDLVMQPSDSCPVVDVMSTLAAKEYDLIVVINHLRSEFGEAMPSQVPYLCWIQDHMDQLCDATAGRSIGDLDLVLTHSPEILSSLYAYPEGRLLATSNLTAMQKSAGTNLAADRERFACDVSFAGHGSETPEQLVDLMAASSSTAFKTMMMFVLRKVNCQLSSQAWITPPDLLQLMLDAEIESKHPPIPPAMRRAHVYPHAARLYDRVFRQQALQWTADWARLRGRSFKIFGRGWDTHPTLGGHACGEVTPGDEIRCLYQASRINLQINGYASLHQRLLDAIAAGGFVLSRFNPADFLHQPFGVLKQFIDVHGLQTLDELIQRAPESSAVCKAIKEAADFAGIEVASTSSPRRAARLKLAQAMNDPAEFHSDEGLFRVLREMRYLPRRAAGEIPGFGETVFRDRASLHTLLDHFVDNAGARETVSTPMRQNITCHDTYDALVERVLTSFFNTTVAAR